ncbi:MAG TPA: hypothetical protein VJK48_01305, partial [Chlamydiales bacterium]|nr:hypothetical protein [Chlamydiales bacterium]
SAQDGLGVVEDQLHTLKGAKVQMKRSQSNLLKNKLTNVRETGANVAEKIGANPKAMTHPKEGGALEKFLTYVGDGQNQFIAIQDKLKELSASDKPINPADMLLVQTKMGIAQQEIEYSSTLLGKVMTSMTTIMNIQL